MSRFCCRLDQAGIRMRRSRHCSAHLQDCHPCGQLQGCDHHLSR